MPDTVAVDERRASVVTGGVDTHADVHVVAALDEIGGRLGVESFPATAAGYRDLEAWLRSFGPLGRVGVEGTGSYGAGLSRHLRAAGVTVVEVSRPDRSARRNRGKSDPLDAENAARQVLAGEATGTPKSQDGIVEAIRVLHTVRRGAVKARTAAINTFAAVLTTAPEELRAKLSGLSRDRRLETAATFRPGSNLDLPLAATKQALRRLARRIQQLGEEIDEAEAELDALTRQAAPRFRAEFGVGPDSAAQLLVTAGDNPDRLVSEASFASLCGTSPVPASSGKTVRHRLSRGGDRQANRALHTVMLCRMRHDPTTKTFVEEQTAKGHSNREIQRKLKRALARRFCKILAPRAPATSARLA
jgi:transposase